MQLNVNDLYLDSLDDINTEERGAVNIDRWMRSANKASKDFIEFLTGRIGESTPELGLITKQKVADFCYPLFRRMMQPFSNGLIAYPPDFNYLMDLRISGDPNWKAGLCTDMPKYTIDQILNGQAGFTQVSAITHDRISGRVNTRIPLLKLRPIAEQYSDGFVLYNQKAQTGSAFIVYLMEPKDVVLNMVQDPGTRLLTYQETGSVHPPFDKKSAPFLARKIAQRYFQFTREEGAIGISDAVSKTQ